MNWMNQWIKEVLRDIPDSGYRARTEKELRDHLETHCRALMENGRTKDEARAETLCAMGEPEKLQAEYNAAWQRSLPGRLRQFGAGTAVWLVSLIIMIGADIVGWLIVWPVVTILSETLDSLIRDFLAAMGAWDTMSILSDCEQIYVFVPVFFSLTLGAVYLRRKFQARGNSVCLVSVPLFVHWVLYCVAGEWLGCLVEGWHMGFVEYLWRIRGLYLPGLAVCIMIGQLFGRMPVKKQKTAAA